jgi:hypothetical protein
MVDLVFNVVSDAQLAHPRRTAYVLQDTFRLLRVAELALKVIGEMNRLILLYVKHVQEVVKHAQVLLIVPCARMDIPIQLLYASLATLGMIM